MTATIRSRLIGSAVAFVLGFGIANVGIILIPSPDRWLWLAVALVLIGTSAAGVLFADTPRRFSVWGLLGSELFAVFTLAPLLWLFTLATTPKGEAAVTLWPQAVDTGRLGAAMDRAAVSAAVTHSLVAAAVATGIGVLLALGAARTLHRQLPGDRRVRLGLGAAALVPLLAWAAPTSELVLAWGLLDSAWTTGIAQLTITLPLATWLLLTVFEQADWATVETVRVTGISRGEFVRRALVPELGPGLAAVTVLVFIAACLDFVVGCSVSANERPLAATLFGLAGDPSTVAAVGLVWMLPMAAVVALLAHRIVRIVGRS